jgi:tRNA-(ms[2]io[6]A)-hydroxylase
MINLRYHTPQAWTDTVLADLDSFMVDHAACERKASATGMNFVVRYPDRTEMIGPMIAFAREEMSHFQQVWTWLNKRGQKLGNDSKDQYVRSLMQHVRTGRDERLMDRLIMAAVVEARGFERFGLVADALPDGPLRSFYEGITLSEGRHRGFFLDMAGIYFDQAAIAERLEAFLDYEAEAIAAQPLRATVH